MVIEIPKLQNVDHLQPVILEGRDGKKQEVYVLPFKTTPDFVLHGERLFRHSIATVFTEATRSTAYETEEAAKSSGIPLQKLILETNSGERVSEAWIPCPPDAPQLVTWGIRAFKHTIANVYRECWGTAAFERAEEAGAES